MLTFVNSRITFSIWMYIMCAIFVQRFGPQDRHFTKSHYYYYYRSCGHGYADSNHVCYLALAWFGAKPPWCVFGEGCPGGNDAITKDDQELTAGFQTHHVKTAFIRHSFLPLSNIRGERSRIMGIVFTI